MKVHHNKLTAKPTFGQEKVENGLHIVTFIEVSIKKKGKTQP